MSVSTNANLAFGFDLGEEWPDALAKKRSEDSGDGNWADFLNSISGLQKPDHADYKKDWPEFWKAQRDFEAAYPVTVVEHCSGDYPMYFLAISGTVQSARRGYPEVAKTSPPSGHQLTALRKFCDEFGIDWKEPDWHIFSYWG